MNGEEENEAKSSENSHREEPLTRKISKGPNSPLPPVSGKPLLTKLPSIKKTTPRLDGLSPKVQTPTTPNDHPEQKDKDESKMKNNEEWKESDEWKKVVASCK